jgi:predicted lysophospholipase L1 biosynthesis ABC-type transport system permease subunit
MYVPWGQSPSPGAWVAAKTSSDPAALLPAIRAAVREANPSMSARELRPMEAAVGDSMLRPRFQTWLLATFGALGLMLAAVGVYGVISYAVSQRTSEIGLRLAVGASPSSVVAMLVGRSMVPVVVGLAGGLTISFAYSALMAGMLGNSSPRDLPTFVATTGLLTCVALTAAWLPAARAARMDPLKALRAD